MANNVTYFTALTAAIDFMEWNNYDCTEVIDKLKTLAKQKATKTNTGKKSATRKKNEDFANALVDAVRNSGIDEFRAAWVRDNVEGINTVAKAVAVLNVAVEMGLIVSEKRAKSATRNEMIYKLA